MQSEYSATVSYSCYLKANRKGLNVTLAKWNEGVFLDIPDPTFWYFIYHVNEVF
jgi:hypothetical protein